MTGMARQHSLPMNLLVVTKLDAMRPETVPGGLWRFFRLLHICTARDSKLLDRIHQCCRCIDGLILSVIRRTKQQF